MAVKIRLSRGGRKKSPFYHIIIADARAPRDGKFIERIGTYNPMTKPASIDLDRDKAFEWIMKGAQPTDTVRAMLRFKGVMYRKHLARGVAKGAMDQDIADKMYQEWIDAKEAKITERRAETQREKEEERKRIFGTPKKKEKIVTAPATEAMEEFKAVDVDAPAAEEAKTEAPAAEEAKTEEPAKEEPKTEEAKAEEPAKEEPKAEEAKTEEPAKEEAKAEEAKTEEPAKEEAKAEEAKTEEPAKEEPKAEEAKTEEPAKEEPKVEEPSKEEVKVAAAAVATVAAGTDKQDDLTKIEGIGPAIGKVLNGASITTFAALAATDAAKLKEILEGAEGNFAMHDPTTWPKQAKMASDGDWDGLKKWQDELDGGKEVSTSAEEE